VEDTILGLQPPAGGGEVRAVGPWGTGMPRKSDQTRKGFRGWPGRQAPKENSGQAANKGKTPEVKTSL